jgi:hypothetical protein
LDITFSINQHDKDGDSFDECILLHINESLILRLNNMEEFIDLIKQLDQMKEQLFQAWAMR